MIHDSAENPLRWREGIPVIRGSNRTVYIGNHRVTMDLSSNEIAWLCSLAEGGPDTDIGFARRGSRTQAIVNYLHGLGVLAPQTECWWLSPHARTALQPHVLALSEWHPDPQLAIAARTTWRIGIHGCGSLAEAIAALLVGCGLTTADPQEADLIVVIGSHGIEAPEALVPVEETEPPLVGDRPHLPVSVYRGHLSVGPLVVPGRTPCLNCLHLHRCDSDPQWPQLVEQWRAAQVALGIDSDPLVSWQAANSAVTMIRHWIDSAHNSPAHRIRWRFPHPLPTYEVPTPHPACGCGWAGSALRTGPATGEGRGTR